MSEADTDGLYLMDAGRMPYAAALELQKALVASKKSGCVRDYLLLVEHPPTITLGRTADRAHVLSTAAALRARGVELFSIERGGDVTYHGPGQLVAYPIIDLKRAGLGIGSFLRLIEAALVEALGALGVEAFAREGLTGVWTRRGKIAAIGIAVTRWISFHGFALNVSTDLTAFDMIVPCGLSEGVTSIDAVTGRHADMAVVKGKVGRALAGRLARKTFVADVETCMAEAD